MSLPDITAHEERKSGTQNKTTFNSITPEHWVPAHVITINEKLKAITENNN